MTKRRIDKKQRQAEQLRKKRAQTAGIWLTAARKPPKAIPVGAMATLASVDLSPPFVPSQEGIAWETPGG
ncbi:MAG TPA: hypothetical protein VGP28_04650 [Methylocella sp.]|jgi:hypothetical protein|nr:hypothetical protein [Methylocella sp.]